MRFDRLIWTLVAMWWMVGGGITRVEAPEAKPGVFEAADGGSENPPPPPRP